MKKISKLAVGAVCTVGITGVLVPSEVHAVSSITNITPAPVGSAISPTKYDVFLDANNPLSITVNVTVPKSPNKLDLFLLQDLTGSFSDDLPVVKALVPSLISSVTGTVADTQFGLGSFADKPISPFGSFSDYVYKTDLGLTANTTAFQASVNGLTLKGGSDFPESQLEALLQTAVRAKTEIGFRDDAFKVAVITTDATFHQAGDFSSRPANNGDAVLDGSPAGTGEDYPSIAQVKAALQAANIIPIFAVTSNVLSTYQSLVSDLGFGSVVTLSSNSSNLVSAITAGLTDAFANITLTAVSDDYGYVQSITPTSFSGVPQGATRTFTVNLLADGIDDADDVLKLVAPGFGETLVNVDVKDTKDTKSVPEPSALLGLLVLGTGGTILKRKQKQKAVA
ncbi:PEP-CTERM sorting domain-containing protein [Halotia branconii]|uniref:PEP-CTERM sorting domain-containing protein n=1 Tax=Halotia branconii CENA392 TaxID=1539056 RepID=A0AAJ6PA49_9CYAN|nr:PEP-CTERM sorting domain-containing protein [Halotia branconii]WGV26411.1 PEP-CTERM sorting domain-containing protein [Halotia branconii CENA392]